MKQTYQFEDFIDITYKAGRIFSMIEFGDVTRAEFVMLFELYKLELGEVINVADVAQQLSVTPPAISRMIKSLDNRGLLYRETDDMCRRKVKLCLSEKGKAVVETNLGKMKEWFDKITESFTEEEIATGLALQEKFCNVCEELKKSSD